jgi:hypothetical protein
LEASGYTLIRPTDVPGGACAHMHAPRPPSAATPQVLGDEFDRAVLGLSDALQQAANQTTEAVQSAKVRAHGRRNCPWARGSP